MAQLTHTPLSAPRLDAYRLALELVALLQPALVHIGRDDKELAAQLRRALPSVPQNLAEAMRRTGRDRGHLLTVALGSVDEVRCIVDVALVKQQLLTHEAARADALADRVCATLFRLRQRLA